MMFCSLEVYETSSKEQSLHGRLFREELDLLSHRKCDFTHSWFVLPSVE